VLSIATVMCLAAATVATFMTSAKASNTWGSYSWKGCANNIRLCTEVDDSSSAFGHYVGHDEPSVLFYSNQPGSGNHMQYNVTLPTEPALPFSDSKGYTLETAPALWFGMAMCDTQSYPESSSTCTPDSDSNIVNPANTKHAPGVAFMELQFYPPGFAPQFAGFSCDATKWCVAMTIDSLSENPFTGTTLNPTCTAKIGGSIEYVNFAYLTLSGTPIGPPNPLQFQFIGSGNPHSSSDTFFMNQGDNVSVSLGDTAHGLSAIVHDNTNPDPATNTGSMVASAANHFGQIKFQPSGNSCQEINYDFHPMYSTSTPQTRVLWAAHSYNVAMDAETGHFDFCSSIDANTDSCNGTEGIPSDQETAEGLSSTSDDFGCFSDTQNANTNYVAPAGQDAAYCVGSNDPGFDGTSDNHYWPNNTANNATPFLFSSPHTGANYTNAYPQAALEADLPRIEASDYGGSCDRTTGSGCTNPPTTDDGASATFYPYFSTVGAGSGCKWGAGELGSDPTGMNSSAQFGPLYFTTYWAFGGHGATVTRANNYNSGAFPNPC
jgi:hypothetical protein